LRMPELVQPREFQQNVQAANKRPRPALCFRTHSRSPNVLPLNPRTLTSSTLGLFSSSSPCRHFERSAAPREISLLFNPLTFRLLNFFFLLSAFPYLSFPSSPLQASTRPLYSSQ